MVEPTPDPGDAVTADEAPVRVVVVDDQQPFLAAARAVVSRTAGFTVVGEATDGAEAQRRVADTSPDLVLMDIRMPEVDGIEAARRMRAADGGPVVFLLSTYAREDLPGEVSTSGAAAYLHKEELTGARLEALWRQHRP